MNKLMKHCILENVDLDRLKAFVKVGDYHSFKKELLLSESETVEEYDRLNEQCNEELNTLLDNFLRTFDENRYY